MISYKRMSHSRDRAEVRDKFIFRKVLVSLDKIPMLIDLTCTLRYVRTVIRLRYGVAST